MSTPAGYKAYCAIVGLNPFHSEGWMPDEQAMYRRWTLDQFRLKWKAQIAAGLPELIRERDGREALINKVGADLRETLRPLVRNPWQACPCHRRRVGMGLPSAIDREEFPEGTSARDRLLTWLRTEFA